MYAVALLPFHQVIGPLYFTHGPAVLEAVHASVEDWPAPCPGSLCPLPFLGETVMFQVPDIDMPPQVASKYRYHRGVHLCASWPRARLQSLTRTLSGCGSVDFAPHPSPNSVRTTNRGSFAPPLEEECPDDNGDSSDGGGGGGGGMRGEQQQPGDRRGLRGGLDCARVVADNGATGNAAAAAADGGGGGGGSRTEETAAAHDGARAATSPGLPVIETPGTPSPRGGGGGGGGAGAFWSGSARSPGVLVSPGLRLSTDGIGEGGQPSVHEHRKSSLGSASLASVICDSPSEVCVG